MTEMDWLDATKANEVFDCILSIHLVRVKHYFAGNGLFDNDVFKSSIKQANQTLSFCGVNANHQNSSAER